MRWKTSPDQVRLESIARLDRLSGLSDKDIKVLVDRGSHLTSDPGQKLAEEGARPNGAYLIIAGEVLVTQAGKEIGRLGPGEFVGEIALLDWSREQTATVEATTAIEVLRYENDDVESLYRLMPKFKRAMDDAAYNRLESDKQE